LNKNTIVLTSVPLESTDAEQPVLSILNGENGDSTVIDHILKNSGDYILKEFEYVTPQGVSKSVLTWIPHRN
jgi:hypothetical protein